MHSYEIGHRAYKYSFIFFLKDGALKEYRVSEGTADDVLEIAGVLFSVAGFVIFRY